MTKEIAKKIRKDLKETFNGKIKFGVRTKYFSQGSSITITIKQADDSCFKQDGNMMCDLKDDIVPQIEEIIGRYQWVESDPYHDYYNCNFFSSISDWNDKKGTWYIERV